MNLRPMLTVLIVLACAPWVTAGDPPKPAAPATPASVALPKANTDGTMSLEKALATRRSLRSMAATPLSLEQLGQLCWAAQGITDDKGHRTAPSARASYPLQLYVIAGAVTGLAPGLYRYEPATHALATLAAGDQRAAFEGHAVGQEWIARAPAIFVISGAVEKMPGGNERGSAFMNVEAGLAAQGFFLQATALGLGSTYVGGFKPAEAREALKLPAGEEVLAVLPVGRRP